MNIVDAAYCIYKKGEPVRRSGFSDSLVADGPYSPLRWQTSGDLFIPTRTDYLMDDWECSTAFPGDSVRTLYRAMIYMYATGGAVRRRSWSDLTSVVPGYFTDPVPRIRYPREGVECEEAFIPTRGDWLASDWTRHMEVLE